MLTACFQLTQSLIRNRLKLDHKLLITCLQYVCSSFSTFSQLQLACYMLRTGQELTINSLPADSFELEQNCDLLTIKFCHLVRKMKSLKLDSKLKEDILRRLKTHRGSSTTDEHLKFFNFCLMPSFNCKSNFNLFIFSWKWQNLIGPLVY